jgi:hypothetical protein
LARIYLTTIYRDKKASQALETKKYEEQKGKAREYQQSLKNKQGGGFDEEDETLRDHVLDETWRKVREYLAEG